MKRTENAVLERLPEARKIIRVSDKRQITIPNEYYQQLGFEKDAVCYIVENSIVIKPLARTGGEFSEFMLADLIKEGYEGEALLGEFVRRQSLVRPAIETMLQEAKQAAQNPDNYTTIDNLFSGDV